MSVSKKELLHIANLASLELKEEEIQDYLDKFQEIIDFSNVINNAPVDDLKITIAAHAAKNRFRKDEVKVFENRDLLLQNAPSQDEGMFRIPKVIK